jgi:acetyltransferase-like isoleucine patch superfamily enzyme
MKPAAKSLFHRISQVLMSPFGALCWLESITTRGRSELIFNSCTQFVALLPGLPGAFLRRAFYTLTLESCSAHCHIGFGSLFAHRQASVGRHTYIGNYALLGSVTLGDHALIGSRASVLSGHALHVLDDGGRWTPYSAERLERVCIGENAWIGEAAVIAADIGESAMVGAGSVVTSTVRPLIVVAGNPARFVRRLDAETSDNDGGNK